jgi:DNA invertase Pin-like site-specific DNA recombinase
MAMEQAAIYCRSSKDRAEVGLDVQRKELNSFAKNRELTIVSEFSDMEISGSLDETARGGLRDMLTALRDPARKWNVILALDTSRIARDPMLALYVTREAEKHGVRVEYAKMPVDGSSAYGESMLSVVRVFDRLHARLSAEKGRDGLTANVAKGYRAGGAAPFGYTLRHEETGGVRDGKAVRKSKLVLEPRTCKKVKAFLQARATGISRAEAAKAAHLQDKAVASLIAMERNALLYAGFQTWNMRRKVHGSRDNAIKHHTMVWRPRSEWIISEKKTHESLITRAEAEKLLALHEIRGPRKPRVRKPETFLLSGLLFTPAGVQWHGDSHDHAYRAGNKGKRINAPWVESEVIYQIADNFADPAFLARTVAEARRMANSIEADPITIDGDIKRTEKQLANLMDLGAETGDKALLVKIRDTEAKINKLREEKAAWAERAALKKALLAISEKDIREVMTLHGIEIKSGKETLSFLGYGEEHRLPPEELRTVLTSVLDRVELDPDTREITIKYRLPVSAAGVKLASPRGFEPRLPP